METPGDIVPLDAATAALVTCAAAIAACGEDVIRDALRAARDVAPAEWVEEVILQSYLFAGFPRALNSMRLWRVISERAAPLHDSERDTERGDSGDRAWSDVADWRARGERTCAAVYGPFYERLRDNIAALHPALDAWMVTEGYGKVLGRPALDLRRRELCVLAACAASQQDRQLHSHLHGALHVGAEPAEVAAALEVAIVTAGSRLDADAPRRYRQLWRKVLGKHDVSGTPGTPSHTTISTDTD